MDPQYFRIQAVYSPSLDPPRTPEEDVPHKQVTLDPDLPPDLAVLDAVSVLDDDDDDYDGVYDDGGGDGGYDNDVLAYYDYL